MLGANAVYCRDWETRASFTRMATAWAELARTAGSLEDTKLKPARSTDALISAWQTLTRIWHCLNWSGFALRHRCAPPQLVTRAFRRRDAVAVGRDQGRWLPLALLGSTAVDYNSRNSIWRRPLADGTFSNSLARHTLAEVRAQGLVNGASKAAMSQRHSFLYPATPKECRKHARNCLRIAEVSPNAEITRTFVDLAHSWTILCARARSAQALLVAVEGMENAGWVWNGAVPRPQR